VSIKFCSSCGGLIELKVPSGDTFQRHICTQCGSTHYLNPKVISGCLVYQNDQVLLCKRAIEPRLGLWTLPAGFMENGETTRQAAIRETLEETGATIKTNELFAITNSPHINHVNIFYLAELKSLDFHSTLESSEVILFKKDDIPWDRIAFHTVKLILEKFFIDIEKGRFSVHEIDF